MRDLEQTPPATTAADDRTFYVINLCASPMPLPLEIAGTPGLEGLVVFRSHQVQEGRHRYRLHLGYFDSRAAAERTLPLINSRYPTAWIATAPRTSLGSLDDTRATDFRLLQAPTVALPESSAAEPAAAPGPVQSSEPDAPQRYAVQLVWSADRTDPVDLPPIALFEAYTLYTVTCQRGGVRLYGIRLGFFRSAISASQVALYIRPDFPSVAVVPVSDREFAYASWLVRHHSPTPPEAVEPASPAAELQVVKQPAPAIIEARTPTHVEIARIRSPEEVPLLPSEPQRTPLPRRVSPSQHWAHTARAIADLDRAARIAAFDAHEIELRAVKTDRNDEPAASLPDLRHFRSTPFPGHRSALARLLSRIAERLG